MVTKTFTCGDILPSGCIVYTGTYPAFMPVEYIPCDARLDFVIEKFGQTIDGILTSIDLTNLDDQGCLVFDPSTVTVAQITQDIIDKICNHETRITALEQTIDIGNSLIEIDLGCLASDAAPCEGPPNTYTIEAVLLTLINEVCNLKQIQEDCGSCTSGTSGTSATGASGTSGTSGVSGGNGPSGTSGTSGSSGTTGTSANPQNWSITRLGGDCLPSQINSNYTIDGFQAGDQVVVRVTYQGMMQKISNNFVRADVSINSPDGTANSDSSTCYSDTNPHSFNITADTFITLTGATALVTVNAVVNNSSESATSVTVSIIQVNGASTDISTSGCRGNSSTGGTCT